MKKRKPFEFDESDKMLHARLSSRGGEILNPRPLFLDATPPRPGLQERIRQMVKIAVSEAKGDEEHETFEEANDFDVKEDFDADELITPYDVSDMNEEFYESKSETEFPPPHPTDGGGKSEPDSENPEPSKTKETPENPE